MQIHVIAIVLYPFVYCQNSKTVDYVDLRIFTFISTVISPTLRIKRQYGKLQYIVCNCSCIRVPVIVGTSGSWKNIVKSGNPVVLIISSIHEAYLFVLSRDTSLKKYMSIIVHIVLFLETKNWGDCFDQPRWPRVRRTFRVF